VCAYAANTVGSADIIDNSILSADIKDAEVGVLDIATNSINSARVIDGTLTGADILESSLGKVPDADTVDGFHANQLGRVASASSTPLAYLDNGRSTLQSVTLVAPRQGFVTLFGSATGDYASACTSFCSVHLRFRNAASATEHGVTSAALPLNTAATRASLSPVATVPVAVGTHTFELIGSWFNNDSLTAAWTNQTLTALYTPFNGSGAMTPAAAVPDDGPSGTTAPDVKSAGD